MGDDLALPQAIHRVLAQKYGVPAAVLADSWAEVVPHPLAAVLTPAAVREDLSYLWEYETEALAGVPLPREDTPPWLLAGIVTLYWVARFLQGGPAPAGPLDLTVQRNTQGFFARGVASYLPADVPVQATGLRIFVNRRGDPAIGAQVLAAGSAFWAVYGPELPRQPGRGRSSTAVTVQRHDSWTVAVVAAMRYVMREVSFHPTLTFGGIIGAATLPEGWSAYPERCPRCRAIVGASGVCYECAKIPAPRIGSPAELQQERQETRDQISTALQSRGLAGGTVGPC